MFFLNTTSIEFPPLQLIHSWSLDGRMHQIQWRIFDRRRVQKNKFIQFTPNGYFFTLYVGKTK